MCRLRFGLFHGLLGFGNFLGASLGTLLALFVENFLAPKQFEESLVRAVTLIPVSADNACITALAIAEASRKAAAIRRVETRIARPRSSCTKSWIVPRTTSVGEGRKSGGAKWP